MLLSLQESDNDATAPRYGNIPIIFLPFETLSVRARSRFRKNFGGIAYNGRNSIVREPARTCNQSRDALCN